MKQHTIIFVPHERTKFRWAKRGFGKWRFTTVQAAVLLGTLAILTIGGSVSAILYVNNSFDLAQLTDLREENLELRRQNQGFERTIRDLGDQLSDYQQQIHKLAIVAGISELAPVGEAGIGGPIDHGSGGPINADPMNAGAFGQIKDSALDPSLIGDASVGGTGEDSKAERLSFLTNSFAAMGRDISMLENRFDDRSLMISSTPAVTPTKGILTSRFGYRPDPFTKRRTFHAGIDIVAPRGKEVQAPGDALVVKTGRVRGLGNAVYLSHGYGITTRYGHLHKILVEEGQRVKRGDPIGQVGNTGRSTGVHLHYEVREDGRPVDPLGYILDSTRE